MVQEHPIPVRSVALPPEIRGLGLAELESPAQVPEPTRQGSADVARILSWAEGRSIPSAAELGAALGRGGVVAVVAERFAADVGLWSDPVTE